MPSTLGKASNFSCEVLFRLHGTGIRYRVVVKISLAWCYENGNLLFQFKNGWQMFLSLQKIDAEPGNS